MTSSGVVGAALASAVDSAGSSTLASSRGAARCGPATSGRSRHAPASASSATSTERLMRPLLRLWMERDSRRQKGCRRVAKRNPKPRVAKTHQRAGLRLLDQWVVGSVEGDAQPEVDHVLLPAGRERPAAGHAQVPDPAVYEVGHGRKRDVAADPDIVPDARREPPARPFN